MVIKKLLISKVFCTVVSPLKVPSTLPSSLVATESHNFSEMSAATFLAVKKQAGKVMVCASLLYLPAQTLPLQLFMCLNSKLTTTTIMIIFSFFYFENYRLFDPQIASANLGRPFIAYS